MVENPRRPIVHWHVLKVRVSALHCVVNRLDRCVLMRLLDALYFL